MNNDNEIDIKELLKRIDSLPPEEKKHGITLLSKLGIDLTSVDSTLTGKIVRGFILENEFFRAESHKDIFIAVIEYLLRKYHDKGNILFELNNHLLEAGGLSSRTESPAIPASAR